jgi:hypothetical protein
MEAVMSEPSVNKPTKKAFHFPKGANGKGATDGMQVDVSVKSTGKAQPAAPKVARRKQVATTEVVPVSAVSEEKSKRVKKEKVVRDSFTMPKSDCAKIAALKQKCLESGMSVKKSELLQAGLLLLESAPVKRLLAAVSTVETVKTGRPAKS